MVVVVVVPLKKGLTKSAGLFNRTKELGKLGLVLEGFELSFGIRIVIGDMGTSMGFRHASIRQQQSNSLGSHRCPLVGMDRQLSRLDLLLEEGLFNQALCQGGCFPVSDHPAHHIATEDIEDDIEIEVRPFKRSM